MTLSLSRAQRRFLGLMGEEDLSDLVGINTPLEMSSAACAALLNYLSQGMAYRSGPLFGYRGPDRYEVTHVLTGTPPGEASEEPFGLNPAYLLGASEALRQVDPGLDWIGHWLMVPGGQMPSDKVARAYVRQAAQLELVDMVTPLLIMGLIDFAPGAVASRWLNRQPRVVPLIWHLD
ncbi:hypothetical protein [Deinococcus sp.]|uniref:hypothetical protein n=1 Tax=Deinococcus sp. TaxID=47478 RepID=UPI003B5AB9A7